MMWPEGADHITKTTKRPLTAGTLFKNSMLALMKTIHSKEPHYVRCIKPNDAKSPALFDKKLVEHQVNITDVMINDHEYNPTVTCNECPCRILNLKLSSSL